MKKIILYVVASIMLFGVCASNGMIEMRDINCSKQAWGNKEVKKMLDAQQDKDHVNAIYLNKCNITSIKNLGLDQYKNAQILNLSDNLIKQLDANQLPKHLRQLNLSNNHLENIKLRGLKQLQILYLAYNQLKKIHELDQLSQLKILDLSYNQIEKIQELDQLSQLKILDLSHNRLQIVDVSQLLQLYILDLSHNLYLSQIDVSKLLQLSKLYLQYNNFTQINISHLPQLQILDLSCNKLSLYKIVIENLDKLEYLFLNGTDVESLYIKNPKNLKVLKIEDNPELKLLSFGASPLALEFMTFYRANDDCRVNVKDGYFPEIRYLNTDRLDLFKDSPATPSRDSISIDTILDD